MAKKRSIIELKNKSVTKLSSTLNISKKIVTDYEQLTAKMDLLHKELQKTRVLFLTLVLPFTKNEIAFYDITNDLSKLFPEINLENVSDTIDLVLFDILGSFLETVSKEKREVWIKLFREDFLCICMLKLEIAYFFKSKSIFDNAIWDHFPMVRREMRFHRSLDCLLTKILYDEAACYNHGQTSHVAFFESVRNGIFSLDDYNKIMHKNSEFMMHLWSHHSETKQIPIGSSLTLSLKIDPLMILIRNITKLISLNYNLSQAEAIKFALAINERYESKISAESMKNKLIIFEKKNKEKLEMVFYKRYSRISKIKNDNYYFFPALREYLK